MLGATTMLCCAHAIFYFKLQEEEQDSFLVHENIYLLIASSAKEARALGEKYAKADENLNEGGTLVLNDKKASYLFAGIRKIIDVQEDPGVEALTALVGIELTYSIYEVDTLEEVFQLARGEMVNVLYRE
jgi:hypothetical protein